MNVRSLLASAPWAVLRQLGKDRAGLGSAVQTAHSKTHLGRLVEADEVVRSICPYCAVGCGQRIYVKDGEITQIEGDPDSPISRGHLCPKGAATQQFVQSPGRIYTMKYRAPHAKEWQDLPLERAMEMIADRVLDARRATWEATDERGRILNRTLGIASLGGATLDNEENYLMKKLYTGLGIVSVENQARI